MFCYVHRIIDLIIYHFTSGDTNAQFYFVVFVWPMSIRLGPKWVRLTLKMDKSGTFSEKFQNIFITCIEMLSGKDPDLSHFEPIWPNLEPTLGSLPSVYLTRVIFYYLPFFLLVALWGVFFRFITRQLVINLLITTKLLNNVDYLLITKQYNKC